MAKLGVDLLMQLNHFLKPILLFKNPFLICRFLLNKIVNYFLIFCKNLQIIKIFFSIKLALEKWLSCIDGAQTSSVVIYHNYWTN